MLMITIQYKAMNNRGILKYLCEVIIDFKYLKLYRLNLITPKTDTLRTDLKDQKTIKEQILIAEKELATLDAKRAALQKRIEQLRVQRQSIADEQFPFERVLEPIVTNESNQEQKIALFRSLFRGRDDVFPGRFESKTSRYVEMSGSGLFVRNPKSNAVIVKTGILYHFPTISFETT
jgi:hypothetical protein